jgi:uncharacterized membrane protein
MTLLLLLLIIIVPYLLLTLVDRKLSGVAIPPKARGRVGLFLFFLFTAIGHFTRTQAMADMLPSFLPFRVEVVYLTGFLEILGAIGLWIPGLVRLTGICLMCMLSGFLPVNIYAAFNHVDFGGHGVGPVYLLIRVPFQILVLGWTYWATDQRWFTGTRSPA